MSKNWDQPFGFPRVPSSKGVLVVGHERLRQQVVPNVAVACAHACLGVAEEGGDASVSLGVLRRLTKGLLLLLSLLSLS